jgi:hypothetical protein
LKYSLRYFIWLCLFVFTSCKNTEPAQSASDESKNGTAPGVRYAFPDKNLQSRITDTLLKIPFVKESNAYIDSLSAHTKGISFILDSAGADKISVMAGYNGSERFETYYNFTVDRRDLTIRITDPESGDIISIEEYIKKNKE